MTKNQAVKKAREINGAAVKVGNKWAVKIVIGSAGGHIFYGHIWNNKEEKK